MATYKARGNAHNVIYPYKNEAGEQKQQWETYTTELEAVQRKASIDYFQKNKMFAEILKAVIEYKRARAIEKAAQTVADSEAESSTGSSVTSEDNTYKTYREFSEKWLPFIARKNRFSPNTYDSYLSNLKNHILPYFGDRVMSTITAEDVDNFVDFLSRKPCKGHKGYGQNLEDIPTLASPSIKKCYNIFTSGFPSAKKWRYITEIPVTSAPAEKTKKRKAWESNQVFSVLENIKEYPMLHLAVHFAFVCSLRAGETAGIAISTVDFHDRSLWITQEVQRVSDKSLAELPKNEIIRVFPKEIATSRSSLILKGPKTEGSHRKQYLTTPLLQEIRERLEQIKRDKEFFGAEYLNNGLLICRPDGRPIDPKSLNKAFKDQQKAMQIENQIEFQGLRKSGQMHKVRLTKNNYQLVAENSGQSPEVLMSNYNEALDSEKRTLSLLVETSFYPQTAADAKVQAGGEVESILQAIQNNPELSQQILQTLLLRAVNA
jgi:integrase